MAKKNKKKISKRDQKIKKYFLGGNKKEDNVLNGMNAGIGAISSVSEGFGSTDNLSGKTQNAMKGIGMATDALSAIPGIGGAIAGGVGALTDIGASIANIFKKKNNTKQGFFNDNSMITENTAANPMGFKNGGKLPKYLNGKKGSNGKYAEVDGINISEFDTISHGIGNSAGLKIDKNGRPTSISPIAEVADKEVLVGDTVFSDNKEMLDKNGKTFAKNAKKITKRMKERGDKITLDTGKLMLTNIERRNTKAREEKEAVEVLKNGGKLPKFENGKMPRYKKWKKEIANSPADGMMDTTKDQYKLFKKFPNKNKSGSYLDENTKRETRKLENHFDRQNQVNNKLDAKYNTSNKDNSNNESNDPNSSKGLNIATGIAKATELGVLASQVFKKTKKYSPINNPNEMKVNKLMKNRKFNLDQLRKNINLGDNKIKQEISDNTTSDSGKRANMISAHQATQEAMANTNVKEQELNNQYRGEEARQLDTLGQQRVMASNLADDYQDRADANKQSGIQAIGKSIGNLGNLSSRVNVRNKENKQYSNILSQKYPDFGISFDDLTAEGQAIMKFKMDNGEEIDKKLLEKYKKSTIS